MLHYAFTSRRFLKSWKLFSFITVKLTSIEQSPLFSRQSACLQSRRSQVRFPGPDQYSGSKNNGEIEMKELPLPYKWLDLRVAWMTTRNTVPCPAGDVKIVSPLSPFVLNTLQSNEVHFFTLLRSPFPQSQRVISFSSSLLYSHYVKMSHTSAIDTLCMAFSGLLPHSFSTTSEVEITHLGKFVWL